MEKVYRIISNFLIKTDDIESLSNKACEELSTGDLVGEIDGKKTTSYRVALKDDTLGKMSLVHVSSSETKEVVYEKGESGWVYSETETRVGGTKLYKHEISLTTDTTDPVEAVNFTIKFVSTKSSTYTDVVELLTDLQCFGWGQFDNADELFAFGIVIMQDHAFAITRGGECIIVYATSAITSDTITPL